MKNEEHTVKAASGNWLGGDSRFDELMRRVGLVAVGKAVSASEWAEIEEFIAENVREEGALNQEEWDKGHKAGVISGHVEIKMSLLNQAADLFKAGRDENARFIREIANTIETR